MVLPGVVLIVEGVLCAAGLGSSVAGIVVGKQSQEHMKGEQEDSSVRMLEIKVNNDIANAPNKVPS